MHAHSFTTIAGEIAFAKDGEWAEPRTVFTQFQDVSTNDSEQFADGKKQPVLWPAQYKTGNIIYPYADAKK
jgi:branched-chain amino acid transport system substrate-binding protein